MLAVYCQHYLMARTGGLIDHICKRATTLIRPTCSRSFSSTSIRSKQRLVILGSGWGGYELLRGVDKKRWDVTVLSPNNYFNFTPLLASCAVGTLEFRCAVEPVRRFSPKVTAYQAWCDSIDFKQKRLKCMPATRQLPASASRHDRDASQFTESGEHFTLKYDKLVIAVGAYVQTFNVPGVKEHAHFLKDVKDARAIRTRILECFEQANLPTMSDVERKKLLNFCIVGAGPTGVEFAAELHDLLHTDIDRYYPTLSRMAKITLYDTADHILGSFDKSLVNYAERNFRRDGIGILTRHHVERVEEGRLFVKEQGEVPFGLLVWSTGIAPSPLIQTITEIAKDERGRLVTDEFLNVLDHQGVPNAEVLAIGDAARIKDIPLPATAQVANQKAKYAAKKLNKLIRDQQYAEPFVFRSQGSLAYVGDWKAIYDRTSAETGKRKESGRVAWLLWRSAYFTMTLSVRNKILVPAYWFLNWIFGRDLTRF